MKKIAAQVNRNWEEIFINIRKETIDKLEFNYQGSTTFKLCSSWALFNFPSRARKDLLDNIDNY